MNDLPTEMETKLIIVSDNSAQIADEITALAELGRYVLKPRKKERLRDIYWDWPDGRLGVKRVALRLRRIDDKTLMTLKGPTETRRGGAAVRMEIEEPWSPDALASLQEILKDSGLWPPAASFGVHLWDPVESLKNSGLVVVQERETERRPRDVIDKEDPDQTCLAELAVDCTTFHAGDTKLVNREIEVESKGPNGSKVVRTVTNLLADRYPDQLRKGAYSKIAMGKAIAAIAKELLGGGGVAEDGSLTPSGHILIETFLSKTAT